MDTETFTAEQRLTVITVDCAHASVGNQEYRKDIFFYSEYNVW